MPVAVLVEVIVDRGVGGDEFLEGFHIPEPSHCSFSPPEWLM
jgi:hypothetical protein